MTPRFLFALFASCVAGMVSCNAQTSADTAVGKVLSVTTNLGDITSEIVSPDGQTTTVKATNGSVEIEFDAGGQLKSILRQSVLPDAPLKWEEEQAKKEALIYLSKLVNAEVIKDLPSVTQENPNGLRNLWSAGWIRNIKGYKVRNDFVTITFTENDGLFGFARSWLTPEPLSLPSIPLAKKEAIKLAEAAAEQVMRKFSNRFNGYRLGSIAFEDLFIVAPNNILSAEVKTEEDLLRGDVNHSRLAWIIGFNVDVDPSGSESTIAITGGLSIWIDAETGACIGGDF